MKGYLLSLPERFVRSVLGLSAGAVREVGEIVIPAHIRRGQLYQQLVGTTLRFLIEQVGGAEGAYPPQERLAEDFLLRRTAGNAVEALGIVAFRASPVWVLAALADLCGVGRELIPEIAASLKAEGLLDGDVEFSSLDQLLDGLERTSSRLAATINTPPLAVPTLRAEWQAIRQEARSIKVPSLPSSATITGLWAELKQESARQERSVFQTSSLLGIAAARKLPDAVRWFAASTALGASRTGQVFASALLDDYRQTLHDIQREGFVVYTARQVRPYIRAAVGQFSPGNRTLTERLLNKFRRVPRDESRL